MPSFRCVLLIIIGLLLSTCIRERYLVVSYKSLAKIHQAYDSIPQGLFIVFPTEFPSDTSEGIRSKTTQLLRRTQQLIEEKRLTLLKQNLRRAEREGSVDASYLHLCWAVFYLVRKEYIQAQIRLTSIQREELRCLKDLLLADCEYEISRKKDKINYTSLLNRYQQIIDCHSDPLWKDIIQQRIRYIRYGS
jgi:hypothetical protein